MAPRTGPSLKELMKGRNKGPSPQDKGKSKQTANPPPPPPQVPADLGLKPNPDLRRKRPVEPTEEAELGPSRGNKQARPIQERRGRRAHSVESREEQPAAQVRQPPRTWSPVLEVVVLPSRWMPHLGTFAVVMQAEWPMLCYSPSSYLQTWPLTGVSTILTYSFP